MKNALKKLNEKFLKKSLVRNSFIPALLCLAVVGCLPDDCKNDDHTFRCVKFMSNYDADTINFEIPNTHPLFGNKIGIRVNGIDTPEIRGENECEKRLAYLAKDLVTDIVGNAENIDLTNVERGKYFRVVADVMVDGKDLKKYILDAGLAYEYDGGTKKKVDWCEVEKELFPEKEVKKKPIEPELEMKPRTRKTSIIFYADKTIEALKIEENGVFYVNGNRVTQDIEVYQAMKRWLENQGCNKF